MSVGRWAGAIFKYYPRPIADYSLFDDGVVPDPDFIDNVQDGKPIPVWAICGVRHRLHLLAPGGMVFFVPVQQLWTKLNINSYICTGILVSSEKVPSTELFLSDGRLSKKYLEGYRQELPHRHDNTETAALRRQNMIIGDGLQSVWFGRNDVELKDVLRQTGLARQANNIGQRNPAIPRLTREESKKLYDELIRRIKPRVNCLTSSKDVEQFQPRDHRQRACDCDDEASERS